MKIELNSSQFACCRESFRQTKLLTEHAECIVPDIYEDVGQIASAEAQLCLKSKDVTEHGVSISGTAEMCVFYITEGREQLRSIRISKDFQADFDCPSITPDTIVQVSLFSQGVQARAVNPRKISVQIGIRVDLCCWTEDTLSLPFGPEDDAPEGLQLRTESAQGVLTVQALEKSFTVSEQLPLSDGGEATGIAFARAELLYTDHQLIGSKALIKGGAELRIVYETQEGSLPLITEQCVPFSVLVDMPDEDCTLSRVSFEPTALYADLGSAINDSRVIELELHAVAQVAFDKTEQLAYLSDAFSTRCPVVLGEGTATLCRRRSTEQLTASAVEQLRTEGDGAQLLASHAEILSFSSRDGKATASAAASLFLRAEDGSLSAQQKLLSFEAALPEQGGEIIGARISSLSAARTGEGFSIEAAAVMDCVSKESEDIRFLSSLELDTENACDIAELPSLTVAKRAGRDLWELAKLYHSSPEAIEALAESYPISADLLLIPRI